MVDFPSRNNALFIAFLDADKIIPELGISFNFNRHFDAIYISHPIIFENNNSDSPDETLNYLSPNMINQKVI